LAKEDILAYQPDVLILVDYPGFNLRMAQFAKSKGIKVIYYISPKFVGMERITGKKNACVRGFALAHSTV
jgi:lipid-A-disaccharide synthase